jgi:hypothetical protein
MSASTDITAYYAFQDNGVDASGNANTAVAWGAATYAAGKVGQGVKTTGSFLAGPVQMRVPTSADVSPGARSFAVWGWIKTDSLLVGVNLCGKGANAAGGFEYGVSVESSGRVAFSVSNTGTGGGAGSIGTAAGLVTINTWHFLLAWWDGTNIYIQVDNGTVYSAPWTLSIFGGTAPLEICWGQTSLQNVLVDEFGIRIGSVPTSDDRDCLYNGGDGGTFPNFCSETYGWVGSLERIANGSDFSAQSFGSETSFALTGPDANFAYLLTQNLADKDGLQPGDAVEVKVRRYGADPINTAAGRQTLKTVKLEWSEK